MKISLPKYPHSPPREEEEEEEEEEGGKQKNTETQKCHQHNEIQLKYLNTDKIPKYHQNAEISPTKIPKYHRNTEIPSK